MILYVSQAKVRFDEGEINEVELFFNTRGEDTFDLDGYIEVAPDEYIENFKGNDLARLTRDKLVDKLEDAEVEYKKEDDDAE